MRFLLWNFLLVNDKKLNIKHENFHNLCLTQGYHLSSFQQPSKSPFVADIQKLFFILVYKKRYLFFWALPIGFLQSFCIFWAVKFYCVTGTFESMRDHSNIIWCNFYGNMSLEISLSRLRIKTPNNDLCFSVYEKMKVSLY